VYWKPEPVLRYFAFITQGIHPKIVQKRPGHASIAITLDTYSHVSPGMQQAAAQSFDEAFGKTYNRRSEKEG
jgi:integrase